MLGNDRKQQGVVYSNDVEPRRQEGLHPLPSSERSSIELKEELERSSFEGRGSKGIVNSDLSAPPEDLELSQDDDVRKLGLGKLRGLGF